MLKKNPNVLDADKFVTAGREFYGIRKGDAGKFTDFGLIESIDITREDVKRTLTGNRRGLTELYKEIIDQSTLTAVFQTASTGDLAVREWFQGTIAIVTGAGTDEDDKIYAYESASKLATGGFIIVQSTQDSEGVAGRSLIRIFPDGSLQGTGNPDIQEFDGYEFTMTATKNKGFTPPASLGDFGTRKPDGFVYDVPNSLLDATLDTLSLALATYVEAEPEAA
ncbi:hypothetical protein [Deinococcus sp. QL22]|uniref:hypothetical protein n=1 Tax=Deinococcus sp. QL22 TaxID=2939437 RepID=UPI002016D725|nr:hypothetical protein [Deinococcus sp. QL22]UQN06290.1 hypothetical protein M1R55_15745 [Deinococcus sp. QL22]